MKLGSMACIKCKLLSKWQPGVVAIYLQLITQHEGALIVQLKRKQMYPPPLDPTLSIYKRLLHHPTRRPWHMSH